MCTYLHDFNDVKKKFNFKLYFILLKVQSHEFFATNFFVKLNYLDHHSKCYFTLSILRILQSDSKPFNEVEADIANIYAW